MLATRHTSFCILWVIFTQIGAPKGVKCVICINEYVYYQDNYEIYEIICNGYSDPEILLIMTADINFSPANTRAYKAMGPKYPNYKSLNINSSEIFNTQTWTQSEV